MKKADLKVGKTYRAKRFREGFGVNNDRFVLYIGKGKVQYDSDTVKNGQSYPMVDMERFLRWAKEEVVE